MVLRRRHEMEPELNEDVTMPAYLSPSPKLRFYGRDGKPLSGGYLFTYQYNTSTHVATWADADMTTRNPVQIQLDANGEPSVNGNPVAIFLEEGKSYKFAWYDSNGNYIDEVEPVVAGGGSGGEQLTAALPIRIVDCVITNNGTDLNVFGDNSWSEGVGVDEYEAAEVVGNIFLDSLIELDYAGSLRAVFPLLIKSPYKTYYLNIPYFMRVRKRLNAEKIRKTG